MEIWQEIALRNVKKVLAESGETQLSFSKNANIGKGHFNEVLAGRRSLTRQFISTIANYVGRDTEWFYVDHDVPAAAPTMTAAAMAQVILEQQKQIDELQAYRDRFADVPSHVLDALATFNGDWSRFERLLGIAPEQIHTSRKNRA